MFKKLSIPLFPSFVWNYAEVDRPFLHMQPKSNPKFGVNKEALNITMFSYLNSFVVLKPLSWKGGETTYLIKNRLLTFRRPLRVYLYQYAFTEHSVDYPN
jgi:hypothetical protein